MNNKIINYDVVKDKVVLFIRDNGGTIKEYDSKKKILEDYCDACDYEITNIIKHDNDIDEEPTNYRHILDLLEDAFNSMNTRIIMYDFKELSDYIEILYVLLEMIADYHISIETICDGDYSGGFGTCDFSFKVDIKAKSILVSKLENIID